LDTPLVSEVVTDYLANRSMAQTIRMDEEVGGYLYHVKPRQGWHGPVDVKPEKVEELVEKLPLVVPGLKVVKNLFFKKKGRAMWERIAQVYDEHGVADERVAYMTTRGVEQGAQQLRLPGVVEVAPRATGSVTSTGSIGKFVNIQSSWTGWGLKVIESGFIQRIREPNLGGPGAYPYRNRVIVGNEWWFVGSRGDSPEMLELEIQGSPLLDKTKMNLLENLANFPRDPTKRSLPDDITYAA
jgi:hypothetical protein